MEIRNFRVGNTIGQFDNGKLVRSFLICEIEDVYYSGEDAIHANLYEINDDIGDTNDKLQWWRLVNIQNISWEILEKSWETIRLGDFIFCCCVGASGASNTDPSVIIVDMETERIVHRSDNKIIEMIRATHDEDYTDYLCNHEMMFNFCKTL